MNTRDTFLEPKVLQCVQILLFKKQEETKETFPNASAVPSAVAFFRASSKSSNLYKFCVN